MTAIATADGRFLVNGSWATTPEYFTALALERLRLPYMFQYKLFGGKRVRGGVSIDFVVYHPFGIPVEVYGEYWHTGMLGADDRLRNQRIANHFKVPEVIIFWGLELQTLDMAVETVRRKLL